MRRTTAFMTGAGIGAALMFALDPRQGKARRAMIEDRVRHVARDAGRELQKWSHDVQNRVRGFLAELGAWLRTERIDDDTLLERVRSKLGRVTRHQATIDLRAERGRIIALGTVDPGERLDVLRAIGRVRGVRGVEDQLRASKASNAGPGPMLT